MISLRDLLFASIVSVIMFTSGFKFFNMLIVDNSIQTIKNDLIIEIFTE